MDERILAMWEDDASEACQCGNWDCGSDRRREGMLELVAEVRRLREIAEKATWSLYNCSEHEGTRLWARARLLDLDHADWLAADSCDVALTKRP